MFTLNRPFVLSIAGMDPSAGAGLLADVKTLEELNCYGLAVNTANTVQNDLEFQTCNWISEDLIFQQLDLLLKRYKIEVVKIGIIENLHTLKAVIDRLLLKNANMKIIWDPVLSSGSGFSFQNLQEFRKNRDAVLERIFLVTPNFEELNQFYSELDREESVERIRVKTNLYLKGGHRTEKIGLDELFTLEGRYFSFEPESRDYSQKHGSGCILSSAVAAHLALNFSLEEAVQKAKRYTERVLASNKSLLGYHNI